MFASREGIHKNLSELHTHFTLDLFSHWFKFALHLSYLNIKKLHKLLHSFPVTMTII